MLLRPSLGFLAAAPSLSFDTTGSGMMTCNTAEIGVYNCYCRERNCEVLDINITIIFQKVSPSYVMIIDLYSFIDNVPKTCSI